MEWVTQAVTVFHKGGLVMYPLLLCSILVIAIAVERWKYYSQMESSEGFSTAFLSAIEAEDFPKAARVCQNAQGITPAILLKALNKHASGAKNIQNMLEGAAAFGAANLKTRLNYLETIVTLAPLLGLLGTVIGMINSFSIMAIKSGQPLAITGGVGEALIATAAGLCVAIMALITYTYFTQRLDRMITEMEQMFTYLLDSIGGGV